MNFSNFKNYYSLSKTLRFSLVPIGKTEETFNNNLILEKDKALSEKYVVVKKLIDKYHKYFIESVLSSLIINGVEDYALLYYKNNKTEKEVASMEALEASMRKQISKALTSDKRYKNIFSKDFIEKTLPDFLSDPEEIEAVEAFHRFTTYFTGFNENRQNMYTEEAKSTAVSYRCINDNLPRFLDNIASFTKISLSIPEDILAELDAECLEIYGIRARDIFSSDYFSFALSQSGIDRYNSIIGGYTCSDGTKVKGLNEYINLFNQQLGREDRAKRLPLLKQLYKQILTDRETVSFVPEKFKDDDELILSLNEFYKNIVEAELDEIESLFRDFNSYNLNGIYISAGAPVTDLSNAVFGAWNVISDSWSSEFISANPMKPKQNSEKYFEDVKKSYKNIKSFCISELQRLGDLYTDNIGENRKSVSEHYVNLIAELICSIKDAYTKAENLLTRPYAECNDKKLCRNDSAIELIKNLLDAVKCLERVLKAFSGSGKESDKDELFYGKLTEINDKLFSLNLIYDKVRNYLTQKPYSKDKIKLNFDNPQFLGGWDKNKERDYLTVLLCRDDKYYLAVMDRDHSKSFLETPDSEGRACYRKIEYKLLPGPNKMLPKVFFASSNIAYYNPSQEILDIRKNETFKKGPNFSLADCHKLIDFYKESIMKHPDWSQFGFVFSETESYKDISEFYREVSNQGYLIRFKDVPVDYIDSLVDNGQLYLFQIYNKDFSAHSKGTPNLHTLYFKMLFDERNLSDIVFKLNGQSEMFYREASINKDEMIVHPANQPIDNKNPASPNKKGLFAYDIVKDKRFTRRQFLLHMPITINYKADGKEFINEDVRRAIKHSDETYIIGIDRGERNLLYICVIDSNGNIVEQKSLNEIISSDGQSVDYHKLLDKKEEERDKARKNWSTIENIKDLKEGYLSQVVHEICRLVVKYNALISLEDLNFGFKKGRFRVEKQVYQKFENMLIQKLNYLADKKISPDEDGGLLYGYQLTNKYDGVSRGKQNGIIFYVPAYLTSKIDPTTGFVDLLKPKYTNLIDSVSFFERFDDIVFNSSENIFEFKLDYTKFPRTESSSVKKWTLCSNGERILTFRNSLKNNEWDNKTVILTDEFKALFEKYGIDYTADLKKSIVENGDKNFHKELIRLVSLMLQMRNSETGNVDVDYLISPVRNSSGVFYDSRCCPDILPQNADANGAYNIARKALWAVGVMKNTPDEGLMKANLAISNADWLGYAQNEDKDLLIVK